MSKIVKQDPDEEYGIIDQEYDDVKVFEVIRYENDGQMLWAIVQSPDGERHRVLVRENDTNYKW